MLIRVTYHMDYQKTVRYSKILRTMLVVALAGCLLVVLVGAENSTWSYSGEDGPSHWKENYPLCDGKRQSPLQFTLPFRNRSIPALSFHSYSGKDFVITNNGHSVKFGLPLSEAKISGGLLPNKYKLVGFHLHWGSKKGRGSEHKVSKISYDAEIHFVHYDETRFHSFENASRDPTGLAVLGVFVKEGKRNNEFQKFRESLLQVINKGSSTNYTGEIKLMNLLPRSKHFYTYLGSLTTPPCYESVIWIVFQHFITFSAGQFKLLRSLQGEHGSMSDNFRPVQPYFGRKVYFVNL